MTTEELMEAKRKIDFILKKRKAENVCPEVDISRGKVDYSGELFFDEAYSESSNKNIFAEGFCIDKGILK
jgi:hypothetical protein